jgi:hypothetical protein
MTKNTCELIRRELDELNLDETCSTAALEHLRECGACREFHEKQTKLRQIVGSLGTVAAPADFDFRLRARLANESSSAASHFNFIAWPVLRRGLAAAALLLVFATGAFLVRSKLNGPAEVTETAKQSPAPAVHESPRQVEQAVAPTATDGGKREVVSLPPSKHPQKNTMGRFEQVAVSKNRRLATVDSSSTGANVINGSEPLASSGAIPIDASSLQSFTVSVDDGRGNAKTISVPAISFGSQRLMHNANQFAPKRVW